MTVRVPAEGPLAAAMGRLRPGDRLPVDGPFDGGLALPDRLSEPACLIGAGTGVAPFRAIVRFLIDSGNAVPVWLVQSARGRQDLLFGEEFAAWQRAHDWFHYVPTLTRDFDDHWRNETGRISEALVRRHIPDGPMTYFLCGPPEFVKDIEAMLARQQGARPEQIRREKW